MTLPLVGFFTLDIAKISIKAGYFLMFFEVNEEIQTKYQEVY